MNIIVCDICRRCIIGNDPSQDATMRPKDLWGSRTFRVTAYNPVDNPTDDNDFDCDEMTLCTSCKEVLYYTMKNREALSNAIQVNRLSNRLRFLFKLPLKVKGGAKDD